MKHPFQSIFKDGQGKVVVGGNVTVYKAGTTTLANIYSSESAVSPITGSVAISGNIGQYNFWVDDSEYFANQKFDLQLSKTGFTTQLYTNIPIIRGLEYDYYADFNEADQGITGNGNTIKAIIDTIGLADKSVALKGGVFTIATNLEVPSNITTKILPNSFIATNPNKSFTINNFEDISLYRAFTNSGTIKLPKRHSHSKWFAKGDGATDDTLALLRWIASADHLILDDGTYIVNRQGSEGVVLGLRSNIIVEGDRNAILKFGAGVNDTNFWRVIGISKSSGAAANYENITLRAFTVDGNTNKTDYDALYEQNHGIFFYNNTGYISNIIVDEMNVGNCSGDGMAISTGTKDVYITNCRATDWLRQGINCAGSGNIVIEKNYSNKMASSTYSGSGIHAEPSLSITGMYVAHNETYALLVSGHNDADPLIGARIHHNRVFGSNIGGAFHKNIEITNNSCPYILITRTVGGKILHNKVETDIDIEGIYVAAVSGVGSDIVIMDNDVSTSYVTPTKAAIYLNQNNGQSILYNKTDNRFKYGIRTQGGSNNKIIGNNASGTTNGLLLSSQAATPTSGISIVANNILDGTVADMDIGDSTWIGLHLSKNKLVNNTVTFSGTPTFIFDDYERISADIGNAAATLYPVTSPQTNIWNTPISADRAVTLSTTGAQNGMKFKIVRTAAATGGFNLNVGTGPLKALAAGQWCEVEHNGTAWFLIAFGSL